MWLLKFLQEPDGKPSITRLLTLGSVGSVLGVFLTLNISSVIKNGGFIDIGQNSLGIILIALGAKVTHSVFKDKTDAKVASNVAKEDPVEAPEDPK